MKIDEQIEYDKELLDILPDGVLVLTPKGEVIQLNQQAQTELHIRTLSDSIHTPLQIENLFELLYHKENVLPLILESLCQGEVKYTLPEHTDILEKSNHT